MIIIEKQDENKKRQENKKERETISLEKVVGNGRVDIKLSTRQGSKVTFSSSSCFFNKSSNRLSSISSCTRSFSTSAVIYNKRIWLGLGSGLGS